MSQFAHGLARPQVRRTRCVACACNAAAHTEYDVGCGRRLSFREGRRIREWIDHARVLRFVDRDRDLVGMVDQKATSQRGMACSIAAPCRLCETCDLPRSTNTRGLLRTARWVTRGAYWLPLSLTSRLIPGGT
jgi:hypothetical protein